MVISVARVESLVSLAAHFNGQPLTVEHGAPLRLLVPVKLGLKNVKAVIRITYALKEPRDY
jgi:DMSO/TMAO reductase YedYZ molybdopterin-dependent catalytic subunit